VQKFPLFPVAGGLCIVALLGAGADLRCNARHSVSKPVLTLKPVQRTAGFNIKGEVSTQPTNGSNLVRASVFAGGNMHPDEVIRFEGQAFFVSSSGKETPFGPISSTFSERLEMTYETKSLPSGSVVRFKGEVRVFNRRDVKIEKLQNRDGTVVLHMNTGTVSFSKIPGTNPGKMKVICEGLGEVHDHGLELVGPDRKTVSNRILLQKGEQIFERETTPYQNTRYLMEPINVRQLIPKRTEPFNLILEIPGVAYGK
jgi:hypothetical protein